MAPSTSSLSSWVLPMDLLLEISARSDPVTLVRSAATCKDLRRHIADPAFHRRLRLRPADRFVPTLRRGFFIQNLDMVVNDHPRFFDPLHRPKEEYPEPFRSFLSEFDTLFHFYRPDLAASHGHVVLRADSENCGMCVFNPMTGYLHMFGPPPAINAPSFALLTGDGHGLYRLLAAELIPGRLWTQVFSQAVDKWLAVEETTVAPCPHDAALLRRPLVLQGDVHWLYSSSEYHFILSFSPARAAVSVTKVDGSCGEMLIGRRPEELLLASDGRHGRHPRLLVAAGLQISLWTLSDSNSDKARWTMQVLVEPQRIRRPAVAWSERLELRWFGDKSGFVFVRMAGAAERSPSWYFALDLATKKVRSICTGAHLDVLCFPYEVDLSFWRPSFPRQLQS
ncbi:hypothetical protein ACQ4PT_047729 [Festuca glaucescens]